MSEDSQQNAPTLTVEAGRSAMWDGLDAQILRSVHSYLAWHSGALFRSSNPSKSARTTYLDARAEEGLIDAGTRGFDITDCRRLRSMKSLDSQTQHETGEQPVCWLDIEMIENGFALPPTLTPPSGLNLEPIAVGYPRFVDYTEFRETYVDLGYYIIHLPGEVHHQIQRLQEEYLKIGGYAYKQEVDSFHFIPPEYHITGVPEDRTRTISQMNPSHDLGKLITIRGQVVELSEYKTKFTTIAWKCKDMMCRNVHFVDQDEYTAMISKPEPSCGKFTEMLGGESEGCNSKHFERLPPPMSNAISVQRLIIQEEDLTDGEAKTMTVELKGSMIATVLAGDGVEVVGILHSEPIGKGINLEKKIIVAKSITEMSTQITNISVSETDREEIVKFVEDTNYQDRMKIVIDEWGGRIYSEDHIKEAIILQSCGGVWNRKAKTSGRIHILLVGDPGTAKSKLLELATEIHPGSRSIQADVSSQAGLFGACVQAEDLYTGKKQWTITPGAMALAHEHGVCAIDEFNLYKGEKSDFNNAMEAGVIEISKVIKAKLKTPAPVIAGANPMNGNKKKWIRGERVPYTEQIGLDFAMLQRFSLIFVLEDTPDKDRDKNIALSMLKGITIAEDDDDEEDEKSAIDMAFIRKYLSLAREVSPLFSKSATNYLANRHSETRQSTQDADELKTHRQLNSLWRLASAIAKFDLSVLVTKEHIMRAEKILAETLTEKDPGLFTTGVSKADREMEKEVREGIISFFTEYDSDDPISSDALHLEVGKRLSAYRKPSLIEFLDIATSITESGTLGIDLLGGQFYKRSD